MLEHETTIWKGHPSHLKDAGFHLACLFFSWLVVPLGFMLWRWLETRNHEIEITSERIRVTTGVLSRRMDETELYRVKDSSVVEPFFLRLAGLSNLVLHTSDTSHPRVVIEAVPDARGLRENLRGCIEKLRETKRVREIDTV